MQWKKRAGYTWEVRGDRALWLKPFGPLPYLPGSRPAHARIDVQMAPGTPEKSLEPGAGVDVADWAKDGNRLTAKFGAVRGDRWLECRFRFTSRVDSDARFELMGTKDAWTYYDNFRVEGATFTNPDFELGGEGGTFSGWGLTGTGSGVVSPPDGAAAGLRAARANHDNRVVKILKLKQGREVTVTFQARAAFPLTPE